MFEKTSWHEAWSFSVEIIILLKPHRLLNMLKYQQSNVTPLVLPRNAFGVQDDDTLPFCWHLNNQSCSLTDAIRSSGIVSCRRNCSEFLTVMYMYIYADIHTYVGGVTSVVLGGLRASRRRPVEAQPTVVVRTSRRAYRIVVKARVRFRTGGGCHCSYVRSLGLAKKVGEKRISSTLAYKFAAKATPVYARRDRTSRRIGEPPVVKRAHCGNAWSSLSRLPARLTLMVCIWKFCYLNDRWFYKFCKRWKGAEEGLTTHLAPRTRRT